MVSLRTDFATQSLYFIMTPIPCRFEEASAAVSALRFRWTAAHFLVFDGDFIAAVLAETRLLATAHGKQKFFPSAVVVIPVIVEMCCAPRTEPLEEMDSPSKGHQKVIWNVTNPTPQPRFYLYQMSQHSPPPQSAAFGAGPTRVQAQ
jgi:hypothetical protein